MTLFKKIFGPKSPTHKEVTNFELLSDNGGGFFYWNGELYHSDIIRGAIRPKANAISKLTAKHIRDNNEFLINPEPNIRLILEEPNPYMSMQDLLFKMAIQRELNGNAFAYLRYDESGYISEIYHLPANSVQTLQGINGDLFLKFYFNKGKDIVLPYSSIIHIRKDFNESDIFGESPAKSLSSLMEVINTTDQGVVKAIKNSAVVKWILKFKSVLKKDDVRQQVKDFVNEYLSIDSENGGAAASDPRYDIEQVKPESYIPNAAQMDKSVQRLYSFFNVNEDIVQSNFTEDQWNAFYESEIEPVAMQLSNEFTRKIFTKRERQQGNRIIFEASSLQYASMSTKLNLVQMVDRGAMTPNEWRKVMNLAPIEGGEKPVRRLDTAVVENGKALKGGENNSRGENEH